MTLATKSEDVGLIVRTSSFQDFQPTSQTDTDGQIDDMRSQDRALHYSGSRGKNVKVTYFWILKKIKNFFKNVRTVLETNLTEHV